MELDGNEKRIQALYSELRLESETRAPSFGDLWPRPALKETEVQARGLRMALLVAFSVIAVACSFAIWSWYKSPASPPRVVVQFGPQQPIVTTSDKPNPVKVVPRTAQPRRHRTVR